MDKSILIIAGEPSGDVRAGELIKELKQLMPGLAYWGIGGDSMRSQGVDLIEHIRNFSVVGVWEVIKNISKIYGQYKKITDEILFRKPSLAILVDYPGFNLRIAKFLRRNNIPVIYYIIPQVWAWGNWRVKSIQKSVDKALVLFKFEKEFLLKYGISSEFVGHPIVDSVEAYKTSSSNNPRSTINNQQPTTIALLPGSRKTEIDNIFPILLDTAEKLRENIKDVSFVLAENSNIDNALYNKYLKNHSTLPLERVTDNTLLCLDRCGFAVVASGTATLETALMAKPMIIVYKASSLSRFIARLVMTVPFFGLVNIIAKGEIVPELLQENLTPENLSASILEIINNPDRLEKMRRDLKTVGDSLGEKGAPGRAAGAVKDFITSNNLYNKVC